jgi:hypothetical protein
MEFERIVTLKFEPPTLMILSYDSGEKRFDRKHLPKEFQIPDSYGMRKASRQSLSGRSSNPTWVCPAPPHSEALKVIIHCASSHDLAQKFHLGANAPISLPVDEEMIFLVRRGNVGNYIKIPNTLDQEKASRRILTQENILPPSARIVTSPEATGYQRGGLLHVRYLERWE